jgi:hypothetical protein
LQITTYNNQQNRKLQYRGRWNTQLKEGQVSKPKGPGIAFEDPLAQLLHNSSKVRTVLTHGLISGTAGLISSKQSPSRGHHGLHRKTRRTSD